MLGWDIRGLKKKVTALEKSDSVPSPEQLQLLKDYTKLSQEEQESKREESSTSAVPSLGES